MPFTPSHAIVALPFIRTPLVASAIAVGAMTPDLPLFLPAVLRPGMAYSVLHDPLWLLVSVALAAVLFLLWRFLLRPATRQLLPRSIATRLPLSWDQSPGETARETFVGSRGATRTGALLLVSLIVGVLSHILWDAFTHEGRLGVALIPALDMMWGPLPGYKWLQYLSGIGGVAVLAVWGFSTLVRAQWNVVRRVLPSWATWMWLLSLPALLVASAIRGYMQWGPITSEFTWQHLGYRTLPQACGIWGGVTVALCLVVLITSRPGRGAGVFERN